MKLADEQNGTLNEPQLKSSQFRLHFYSNQAG